MNISQKALRLAERLATLRGVPVTRVVEQAIEESARAVGIGPERERPRRRMSSEAMLAVGAEIAAMPLLDKRSPREIMDDLNAA